MRDATKGGAINEHQQAYFNPRIPCGMRPDYGDSFAKVREISIHASHAGCDAVAMRGRYNDEGISIHASHAGCDLWAVVFMKGGHIFQSTHPMRDATVCPCTVRVQVIPFQSTHPMRDATATYSGCPKMVSKYTLLWTDSII